jgi:serine/threonine protein kinase/WD40 repeat protein
MHTDQLSVKAIFDEAVEIEEAEARRAYLDRACGDNLDIRCKLDALLQAYVDAGSFLQKPVIDAETTDDFHPVERLRDPLAARPVAEGPGTCIGPYKLLQQIGEGGMGVVYMAEQEKPVRRRVALKIIKPGMDTKQVIARFEAERQALALMDHQNIARVMEAGTTDSGRPYFIMELVHGVPITKYCDDAQLTPRERLELFIPVCQAIQHAHQKGIIHRDIKPSNVLVTLYDGKPVAKVIDFGVAKATDQRLTERTMFTQYGSIVGTLEYMSPEQAEMSALGVDTRSDIYALGVLLYELLAGSTPLERATLREAGYAEILKRIKEEEPPRPSTRLSESRDRLPSISSQRKTDPSKLAGLLRGELDWIVMKSLEKDRSRRYETANAFARDVERYLKDETVEACPPSASYRFGKFFRKNQVAIATISAFTGLLIAGAGMSIAMAVLAARAERLATLEATRARHAEVLTRTERDRALTAESEAISRRDEAEKVRQSLRRSLYVSDLQLAEEAWESGNVVRMRELLDGQRPRPGEDDLRGFEWHYLRRLGSNLRVVEFSKDTGGIVSPDATRYAATIRSEGKEEFQLRVWDITSGRELRPFIPFFAGGTVEWGGPCGFSADGKRIAWSAQVRDSAGRVSCQLKVWDWESRRELLALGDLGPFPDAYTFDRTARRLAGSVRRSGMGGCDLKVWAVDGGKELLSIPLPDQWVELGRQSIAFSPDGERLAALTKPPSLGKPGVGGDVRVWDTGSGKELSRFKAGPVGAFGMAYSPDGSRLAVVDVHRGVGIQIRDAKSNAEVLELTGAGEIGRFFYVAFSPDGTRLAGVSQEDGKLRIWDLSADGPVGSRRPVDVLPGNSTPLGDAAWNTAGRSVSAAALGKVLTWEVAPRGESVVVRGSAGTAQVRATVSADASRFAAVFGSNDGKNEVKVWDEAGNVLFSTTDASPVNAVQSLSFVRLSRDGARLAYSGTKPVIVKDQVKLVSRLLVWNIEAGRVVFRYEEEGGYSLEPEDFSPDGRRLVVSRSSLANVDNDKQLDRVSVWDLDNGEERLRLNVPLKLFSPVFSPDGRRIAVGLSNLPDATGEAELRVWDAATGAVILSRKWPFTRISRPAYSSDGKLLAVAIGDALEAGEVRVLDAAVGTELQAFSGHGSFLDRIDFSPEGRRLVSSSTFEFSAKDEVNLWDIASGRELLRLKASGHGEFAFSPDGHRLSYIRGGARRDAEVQVWDATPQPDERQPISRGLP